MKPPIHPLGSADASPWTDGVAASDRLPVRDSGPWIETKHRLLAYYADMFATGMKHRWGSRVYLELFSGPGRCVIRDTGAEAPGSPLKVIGHEFTKFIFTEKSVLAAEALAARLDPYENSRLAEIWCGDCAEAIQQIHVPAGSLTFAFIDPTGIAHAPFSLIETLSGMTRCDLLINIQHGMGIKMNIHQHTGRYRAVGPDQVPWQRSVEEPISAQSGGFLPWCAGPVQTATRWPWLRVHWSRSADRSAERDAAVSAAIRQQA